MTYMNYKKILKKKLVFLTSYINLIIKSFFLIDTNNNNTFTTFPYKKTTSINICTLNYKSEWPITKQAIIKNLINHEKVNSSMEKNFYTELINIKQSLIMTFLITSLVNKSDKPLEILT